MLEGLADFLQAKCVPQEVAGAQVKALASANALLPIPPDHISCFQVADEVVEVMDLAGEVAEDTAAAAWEQLAAAEHDDDGDEVNKEKATARE